MNERRRYDAMYGILFFSDDNIYRTPNVLYSTKALDKVTIFPFLVWIGVAAENFKIWYDFISEIYIDSVVQQKTKCECWIKNFHVFNSRDFYSATDEMTNKFDTNEEPKQKKK